VTEGTTRPLDTEAQRSQVWPGEPSNAPPVLTPPSIGEGFFGSLSMRRLLSAQFVSSLGDWIGIVALLAVADRLTQGTAFATFGAGFVLLSRLVPGLFLAPAAGVLVDRLDRRKVMVTCDIGRGVLIMTIPFVTRLWVLLVVSLLLEAGQLMWVPAKEASVPNLVSGPYVQRANSLSLAAAYGTFPLGAAVFAGLARVAAILGSVSFLRSLEVNQESLALFVDAATFLTSGFLVSRLVLPQGPSHLSPNQPGVFDTWQDLKVGLRFIMGDRLVRTVMAGLGAALFGAGAVVSLGPTFVRRLLSGGPAGFGLVLFSLGMGAAMGVLLANTAGRKLSPVLVYTGSCTLAGASLVLAASMSSLIPGALFVGLVGLFGAPGYSAGFTLMHQHVSDELRGRVFGALLTVIRLCMVVSLALSPIFAGVVDELVRAVFPGAVLDFGAFRFNVAGVRITLWLAGVLIGGSGLWAGRRLWWKVRRGQRRIAGELPAGVTPEDAAPFGSPPDSQ
jgi:dTMP kinase